jgi:aminopeptidase N
MADTSEVKKYRFTREDFQPLQTKPLHFDMVFDITESKVCADESLYVAT